jgi:hypothetical protein
MAGRSKERPAIFLAGVVTDVRADVSAEVVADAMRNAPGRR